VTEVARGLDHAAGADGEHAFPLQLADCGADLARVQSFARLDIFDRQLPAGLGGRAQGRHDANHRGIVLEIVLAGLCERHDRPERLGENDDQSLDLQAAEGSADLGDLEARGLGQVLFGQAFLRRGGPQGRRDLDLVRVEALGELRHLAHRRALREDAAALL